MTTFNMTDLMLRLRDFLSEPAPIFWQDDELENIINDIQREVAQSTCCYQTIDSDVTTAAATRNVSNLGGSYRVDAVEYKPTSGNPFALRKILPQQIGRVANSEITTPQCWMEFGSGVGIDPLPAAAHNLTVYLCAAPPEISPAPNLGIGTTATHVKTDDFLYYISGTKYAKAAVPAGTALTGSNIPSGKYGAWRLEIGSDGTIDVVAASANATGYASALLALAGLPALTSGHVAIGTVTVMKSDADFTVGTTALSAANVTAAFTDDATLSSTPTIPRQFWPLILLGAMARALSKNPRYVAAAQQIEAMYYSELRFHAFDFYEQVPTPHADMRYE
jgi:hypothetical protein